MADEAENNGRLINESESDDLQVETVAEDSAQHGPDTETPIAGPSLLVDSSDNEEEGVDAEEYEPDDENPMSVLPEDVVKRVDKLLELNAERDEIADEYLKERAALEARYQALYKPLYGKRLEISRGDRDDEIAAELATEGEATSGDPGAEAPKDKAVGIPQFWVCAMGNMEAVAEHVTEEDVDCLEHLQDVTCEDDPAGTGFTLRFHFAPNEYFTDTVLTKKYDVPNLLLADEPILKNVEGCKIHWKEGKSLTRRVVQKKQRGKGKNAGQIRTVSKKERKESFFHFFEPPKMPSLGGMDEEQADQLEEFFDSDYDTAQAFRSHIIPKAVLWFTGQAMDEEMADMFGSDMPPELLDGTSGAFGSNPFPPSAPGEQPPECQQN